MVSGLDAKLTPSRARRLQTATEGAKSVTVVIAEPATSARLQGASLKLQLQRRAHHIQIEVSKDRSGHATGRHLRLSTTPGDLL